MEKERVPGFAPGFAHLYLAGCGGKSDDEIDIQVYTRLMEVDSRIGVSAAEQLCSCLFHTLRLDVIKVCIPKKMILKL